jgi:hypothetical protein
MIRWGAGEGGVQGRRWGEEADRGAAGDGGVAEGRASRRARRPHLAEGGLISCPPRADGAAAATSNAGGITARTPCGAESERGPPPGTPAQPRLPWSDVDAPGHGGRGGRGSWPRICGTEHAPAEPPWGRWCCASQATTSADSGGLVGMAGATRDATSSHLQSMSRDPACALERIPLVPKYTSRT